MTSARASAIEVFSAVEKPKDIDIAEAEVIVAIGRGASGEAMRTMAKELADLLGGVVACTRPLVENNTMDAKHQIGLSGRTVKPKLIFTLGPDLDCGSYIRDGFVGFPDSYDLAKTIDYLAANYGFPCTAEEIALIEGKTLAEIKADEALKAACEGLNLAEICIVSACDWNEPEEGAEVANGVNFPALTIGVSEAKGAKCPRCWMHSEAADENGLCPRCAAVIAKMDVEF